LKSIVATILCSLMSIAYLSGCAAQKQWADTGGSRADGTVQLEYEYGEFEKPEVDDAQGVELAASRCAAWGYTGSEPFGSGMRKCEAFGGYGNCLSWIVTKNFQCLGAPSSSNAPQTAAAVAYPARVAATSANQGSAATSSVPPPSSVVDPNAATAANPPSLPVTANPNSLSNKPTSFDNWDRSTN
jgi:hypothetical protein